MLQLFKKLILLLDKQDLKKASILLIMILIMGFLEMAGVASIMPFIGVLTNPELVYSNNILNHIYTYSENLGIKNSFQFLFLLGILVLVILITSITFKALTTYTQLYFIKNCEYTIGKRLIKSYLYQPYSWFLNRHSADLTRTILSEVNFVIDHGINPMMNLIAQSFIIITISTLLLLIDPKIAMIVGFSLLLVYGLIYKFIRGILNRLGLERLKANQMRFTAVNVLSDPSKR